MLAKIKKAALAAIIAFPISYQGYLNFSEIDIDHVNKSSVKLLTKSKSGGGSGMVFKSMPERSWILTNNHVCKALEKGGWAKTHKGEFPIHAMQRSKIHDLCMVEVLIDLEIQNTIAQNAPKKTEKVWVAGHPRLLPLIINEGRVSERESIDVAMGYKKCSEEDFKNKKYQQECFFTGFRAIIKTFDSLLISNFIQGGSSGSPVYNEHGEVVAVVFAGSSPVSQAWCVPWEYVKLFIDKELDESKFELVKGL